MIKNFVDLWSLFSVQTFVYNSFLLNGLEFDFTVRDFLCPWHWFLINFNVIRNCIQKFVLVRLFSKCRYSNKFWYQSYNYIPKWKCKNVYRTIEISQRTRICKANCCLKFHNVHFKLQIANFGIKQHAIPLQLKQ